MIHIFPSANNALLRHETEHSYVTKQHIVTSPKTTYLHHETAKCDKNLEKVLAEKTNWQFLGLPDQRFVKWRLKPIQFASKFVRRKRAPAIRDYQPLASHKAEAWWRRGPVRETQVHTLFPGISVAAETTNTRFKQEDEADHVKSVACSFKIKNFWWGF